MKAFSKYIDDVLNDSSLAKLIDGMNDKERQCLAEILELNKSERSDPNNSITAIRGLYPCLVKPKKLGFISKLFGIKPVAATPVRSYRFALQSVRDLLTPYCPGLLKGNASQYQNKPSEIEARIATEIVNIFKGQLKKRELMQVQDGISEHLGKLGVQNSNVLWGGEITPYRTFILSAIALEVIRNNINFNVPYDDYKDVVTSLDFLGMEMKKVYDKIELRTQIKNEKLRKLLLVILFLVMSKNNREKTPWAGSI